MATRNLNARLAALEQGLAPRSAHDIRTALQFADDIDLARMEELLVRYAVQSPDALPVDAATEWTRIMDRVITAVRQSPVAGGALSMTQEQREELAQRQETRGCDGNKA